MAEAAQPAKSQSPGEAPCDNGPMPDTDTNHLLRHMLATLAYRGHKAIEGANAAFATVQLGQGIRTPVQLLSHIGDLLVWSATLVRGQERPSFRVASWDEECARFDAALADLDRCFLSHRLEPATEKRLLQGPLSDAMTHIGQLAMMRRWAGDPLPPENYSRAPIEAGRF